MEQIQLRGTISAAAHAAYAPMQPPPPGERQPPLIPLIGAWVFGALVLFCGCCWLCCTRCLPESCSSCLPFSKAARNRRKKDKAALAAAKRFTPEAQAIYGRPGGAIYGRGPPPSLPIYASRLNNLPPHPPSSRGPSLRLRLASR